MILTLENLHEYTTEDGDCLLWNRFLNSCGVPTYWSSERGNMASVRVRVVTLQGLRVRKGQKIRPTCGNPRCLSHLKVMTQGEAISDGWKDVDRAKLIPRRRAARLANTTLAKGLTDAEKAHIDAHKDTTSQAEIARQLGRSSAAVWSYINGLTYAKTLPTASVFGWRP